MSRSCGDCEMKTDQTDKVSKPERQRQPEHMTGVYEIIKEKGDVNRMCTGSWNT